MSLWSELKTNFNLETVNLNPEHDLRVIKSDTCQNWINDPCESANWINVPCESAYSDKKKLSKDFFYEIREKAGDLHTHLR